MIEGLEPWKVSENFKELKPEQDKEFLSYERKIGKIMALVTPYLIPSITDDQVIALQKKLYEFFEDDPTGARATMKLEKKIKLLEKQLEKERKANADKFPEMELLAKNKTTMEIANFYGISYGKAVYELDKRGLTPVKQRKR